MFTVDYSKNEKMSFEPLPEGNYECIIESTKEDATPNGKEKFQLKLVVRNDLDKALPETNGKYKNRILFNDNWKRQIDGKYIYDMSHFMYILQAAGIKEGTKISGMNDLHELLRGKPVKIFTKVEYNDYQGEDENTIAPWGYSKSDYPNVQHTFKDDKKKSNATLADNPFNDVSSGGDIIDEDLPF